MKQGWHKVINMGLALVLVAMLAVTVLSATPVWAQATEILKPTDYTFSDTGTNNNPTYAYDGTTGGDSVNYNRLGVSDNISDPTIEYHTWQSPGQTHSARRLYVRRSGTGNTNDTWGIYYSTNGGTDYTVIETGLISPSLGTTLAVTIITGLDLSTLWVKISTGKSAGPDYGFADIYDVWLEGDYAVNEGPSVTSVQLWTTGGSPTTTTSMTPQVEYNIKVAVSDADTLNDLSTVTVRIFYDSDGSYAAGDETGSADTQTLAILTRTVGSSWAIDPSSSTTWSLETGNSVEPTLTASSGTFEFHFKPGKVATETTGSAKWHVYAEADDGTATASGTAENNAMSWYGEISVNTASVNWGTLPTGTDFGGSSNQTDIQVLYIANGAYYKQIATSASWTASSNATLDVTGDVSSANEFSLKADDTTTLGSAVFVTASPSYATIDNSGVLTTESGDNVTANTIWLKLASTFATYTYSGTIYYKITDGS